ncbi:MAG: autoinducer binding domain-containing protein, partial [Albidovulum sp.]|uniref:autoinducer binding domain-containing protein n=1 Tax=Albidovulum sp. TaxID=1872424 RepID=UPI003C92D638
AGYCAILNFTRHGPQYIDNAYPAEWQAEYEASSFHFLDPVFVWALAKSNGDIRWSEVKLPDFGSIFKKARKHNLMYGAAFVRMVNRNKTLVSVAREDRELEDQEMLHVSNLVSSLVHEIAEDRTLSEKELAAIQILANDATLESAAKTLGISVSAVKARLATARTKTNADTNYHLVAYCLRAQLIT